MSKAVAYHYYYYMFQKVRISHGLKLDFEMGKMVAYYYYLYMFLNELNSNFDLGKFIKTGISPVFLSVR